MPQEMYNRCISNYEYIFGINDLCALENVSLYSFFFIEIFKMLC